jgi:Ca2+-transporting ATPase
MQIAQFGKDGAGFEAHAMTAAAVIAMLVTSVETGLSSAEAARRLAEAGRNELAAEAPVPVWRRALSQLTSPLVLLLLAASAISGAAWAIEPKTSVPYEALVILAIVIANAALGWLQEARAEAAVANLRRLTASRATVLRDGVRAVVDVELLVPGDVLLVGEGAVVPADARVVEAVALRTIEAALTGESGPVDKQVEPVASKCLAADRTNMLFSGTTVVFGHGRAVVTATGMRSEIGRIAGMLAVTEEERTPLQAELDRTGKILGIVVTCIAITVGITLLLLQRDFSFAALTATLIYAVALAVAAVPEGLTAITTAVLSLGTQRMARRNVIIRRLSAVETLGAATVICSDKTGTLTRNEMTVRVLLTATGRAVFSGSGYEPRGEVRAAGAPIVDADHVHEIRTVLSAGFVSNNAELVNLQGAPGVVGDPTEGALKVAALKAGLHPAHLHADFPRIGEIPFSSERKLMSTAHAGPSDAVADILFVKGAPDVLLGRCRAELAGFAERPLDEGRRAEIRRSIDALGDEALRTLGLACRKLARADATGGAPALQPVLEHELVWLGVVGMIDPPRLEAAQAVMAAQAAGVRVIMITGDHPRSAAAIGREIGIAHAAGQVTNGAEIEGMDDEALAQVVQNVNVYARVSPEHKLRIVHALKRHGEVVAMTGDGVNDAPALKAADIGVAMGIAGTDVAKGAADMILTDDNFASIVAAIEEGRSIYSNIQKFLRYLLATNLGEVAVMFIGVVAAGVLGITSGAGGAVVLPLTAAMILWINLVTDAGPALAVGVDAASPRLMRRPPRARSLGIITPAMWRSIAMVAVTIAVGTLGILDAALPGGLIDGDGSLAHARTLAFHTLVLFSLFAVFAARSDEASAWRDVGANLWLWVAVAGSLLLQMAVLYLAPLQRAFDTVALDARDWLIAVAVASSVLWVREGEKWVRRLNRGSAA